MLPNHDFGLFEEIERGVVQRVVQVKNDFNDTTIDDHLGAHQARGKGCVERSVLDARAVIGSLSDGILFSMRTQTLL